MRNLIVILAAATAAPPAARAAAPPRAASVGAKVEARSKAEVEIKAAKQSLTKVEDKAGPGVQGPTLRGEDVLDVVQAKVAKLRDAQIKTLERLIDATSDNDKEKPDLYFRLAELLAEKSTYYGFRARSMDEPIFREKSADKKRALLARQKQYEEAGRRFLTEAVKTYLVVANSDIPTFRQYDRMDHVLFYLAFLLSQAKKTAEARVFFHRLIKDYPTSRFIPDAYLSFAEYYFYEGDMEAALKFYEKIAQYPQSKVYGFALYKQGWCFLNLQDHRKALEMFVATIRLVNEAPPDREIANRAALGREALRDSVVAYSHVGTPDKAFRFFERLGGAEQAPKLFERLGEIYFAQGKFIESMKVYREMIALQTESDRICDWQHNVVRSSLSAKDKEMQVVEVKRMAEVYKLVRDRQGTTETVRTECRTNTAGMLRELATIWHKEAQKTRDYETYALAQHMYREYLELFPEEEDACTMRFYYAELLFKLGEETRGKHDYWERAAEQYTGVVKSCAKSEFLKEAAYAAVISWKNALNVADDVVATNTGDNKQPTAIPENQLKMIEAFDTYLRYVPDAPERVQILYNKARIHYEHNHYAEAAPIFDEIATQHSGHELGVFAANQYLDCLNVLERYDELNTTVDRYLKIEPLVADQSMYEQLQRLKQGAQWKQADKIMTEARALRDQGELTLATARFKDAALLYVEIANAYPQWERFPQVLFNSALAFEAAYLIGQAISMREKLIAWADEKKKADPKARHPEAQKAIYQIGANYHAMAWYSRAADYYERFAGKYPGEEEAPGALASAAVFRMGLGEDDKAIADIDLFVRNYGPRKGNKELGATLFYDQGTIFEKRNQPDKVIEHYQRYLDRWGKEGGVDREIRAHMKIAELLWAQSCAAGGVDGSCVAIERVKARVAIKGQAAKGQKGKRKVDVNLTQCGPDTKMKITVLDRKAAQAGEARKHSGSALRLYAGGKAIDKVGGKDESEKSARLRLMMDAVARARFMQGEAAFEDFLRVKFPEGLSFDPKNEKRLQESQKRFADWLELKGSKLGAARDIYLEVIDISGKGQTPHWAIAASARIGQLYQTFADQLFTAPIPEPPAPPKEIMAAPAEYRKEFLEEYYQTFRDTYCDAMTDKAEPLEAKAVEGLSTCLATSTRLSWFNEWSRLCERELNQINPAEYPLASEIRAQPGYVARVGGEPTVVELQ